MIHWRRGEVSALTGGWGEVITCEVALEDGSSLPGFVATPAALPGATEITHHGGWRAYLATRENA